MEQPAQVARLVALALPLELREGLVDGDHALLRVEEQVMRELGAENSRLLRLRLRRGLLLVLVGCWLRVAVLGDVALLARDLAARLALLVEPAAAADMASRAGRG